MKFLGVVLVTLLMFFGIAKGQDTEQEKYDVALEAWDMGDYPQSLVYMKDLLNYSKGDQWLDQIALVTGEMYQVEEIAVDGRNIQWGPRGNYLTYDTNGKTHIIAVVNSQAMPVGEITGRSVLINPSLDEIAYLKVNDTPEISKLRANLVEMRRIRDFSNFRLTMNNLNQLESQSTEIMIRNLLSGDETKLNTENMSVMGIAYADDGQSLYMTSGITGTEDSNHIYRVSKSDPPIQISNQPGSKGSSLIVPGGRYLIYTTGREGFVLYDLEKHEEAPFAGHSIDISEDGSTVVYLVQNEMDQMLNVLNLSTALPIKTIQKTTNRLANPVLSSDGQKIAYQMRLREDWEIYLVNRDGTDEIRVTYDIQHDIFPSFIDQDNLLGIIGEGRHRRSFRYSLGSGGKTRLFHNNTIRTVAPEYEWAIHPDGKKILIVSERDGDTISPERGVYLLDLTKKLKKKDIVDRLDRMLILELDLRARGENMFESLSDDIKGVVQKASVNRISGYASDLYRFGSKFITEPGNHKAIEYLTSTLKSFGYEVEQQWFDPRPGVPSANVIATLPGTLNPDLVYVISSHFDSVRRGPGADDNSSGTTALIEAARMLVDHPMPATIQFAFFTGEEAGLLGSREFVRQAVENKVNLVGALNNDMVGWANNHRLDNTIRYSNVGIRDIQHAAAFLFTDLITYDAKYYKSTDAHAYFEAYGDIVGGIGSYPILSSPHYHQSHDVLEIINQKLVTEVSKTTVGTIMLMASSPARLSNIKIDNIDEGVGLVSWTPAQEKDIGTYLVKYGSDEKNLKSVTVNEPNVNLSGLESGMKVYVKAVNSRNMPSWDWAILNVP